MQLLLVIFQLIDQGIGIDSNYYRSVHLQPFRLEMKAQPNISEPARQQKIYDTNKISNAPIE